MSYEFIVLLADSLDPARRRDIVDRAARDVPGAIGSTLIESVSATAALIETDPPGGCFGAAVSTSPVEGSLTVALAPAGLDVPDASAPSVGTEAGHAAVRLRADGSVVVTTDGIGAVPVFYGKGSDGVIVSTHLASLVSAGLSPALDLDGVVSYLAFLHPLEQRTLLRDASLVPPGGSLTIRSGQVSVVSRPLFGVPSPQDHLSDDEVIAEMARRWPGIVADAMTAGQRVGVGLSGGLDSRLIVEEAERAGFRPLTFTYGSPPTRDVVVAREVAEALELPHLSFPVSDDALLRRAVDGLALLDGAHSSAEMYELWFAEALRGVIDVVVSGIVGGPLWGNEKSFGATDLDSVLAQKMSGYAGTLGVVESLLAPQLRAEAQERLREQVRGSLSRWDFSARPDMALYWQMANRQQRWGTMLLTLLRRVGLQPRAPFLDSRFLELAARLSPEQHRNGRLYLRAHRELFPKTAAIRRSDDGNPPRRLDHVYWTADRPLVRQLGELAARHPVSGARRGARIGTQLVLDELRSRAQISAPADRFDQWRAVFPTDAWVRTRPAYAWRLAELIDVVEDCSVLDTSELRGAAQALRRREPTVPAVLLGRVAAVARWQQDYDRRAADARGD